MGGVSSLRRKLQSYHMCSTNPSSKFLPQCPDTVPSPHRSVPEPATTKTADDPPQTRSIEAFIKLYNKTCRYLVPGVVEQGTISIPLVIFERGDRDALTKLYDEYNPLVVPGNTLTWSVQNTCVHDPRPPQQHKVECTNATVCELILLKCVLNTFAANINPMQYCFTQQGKVTIVEWFDKNFVVAPGTMSVMQRTTMSDDSLFPTVVAQRTLPDNLWDAALATGRHPTGGSRRRLRRPCRSRCRHPRRSRPLRRRQRQKR
jgi:hypothetical protein